MSDEAFDIAAGGTAAQRVAMDAIAREIAGPAAALFSSAPPGSEFIPASFGGALDDALSVGGSDDFNTPASGDRFTLLDAADEPAITQFDAWTQTGDASKPAPEENPETNT